MPAIRPPRPTRPGLPGANCQPRHIACTIDEQAMLDSVSDTTGSTYVEYVVVVGMLALVAAAAVLALGIPLLRMYRFSELVLTIPI